MSTISISSMLLRTIALCFLSIFCRLPEVKCQVDSSLPIGTIDYISPGLSAVISKKAKVIIVADNLDWCEGPLWVKEKNMLLFSDIPKNCIYKWTAKRGKEMYLTPSGYTGLQPRKGEPGSNALLLNNKGQLVLCQHGDRRIALMDAPLDHPQSRFITVADNYQGKKFDSPNDAVYRSNGDLYFTDPPYGLENNAADTNKQAPYQGIYKVSTDGKVTLLVDSITRPNGIAFLPGEKTVLIASSDPAKAVWYSYDLDENGLFINGKIFHDVTRESLTETGLPDGLKVDKHGNIFATGPGGVWIFNREGKLLGKIRVNGVASNCVFADNEKTLFITADMYVLKVNLR